MHGRNVVCMPQKRRHMVCHGGGRPGVMRRLKAVAAHPSPPFGQRNGEPGRRSHSRMDGWVRFASSDLRRVRFVRVQDMTLDRVAHPVVVGGDWLGAWVERCPTAPGPYRRPAERSTTPRSSDRPGTNEYVRRPHTHTHCLTRSVCVGAWHSTQRSPAPAPTRRRIACRDKQTNETARSHLLNVCCCSCLMKE
jgi:hypothetical protein